MLQTGLASLQLTDTVHCIALLHISVPLFTS